ncbi:hypothetical protein BBJ28_00017370 [Nothophytophthora sp. Chile5]|nr:hypothetical protein BBJ28_00017370 [Nothophytophthora sp. Chile5]
MAPPLTPTPSDQQFLQLVTPKSTVPRASFVGSTAGKELVEDGIQALRPRWTLYSSVFVSLLLPLQYGWSTSQLNLSTYNDEDDCNARPVVDGTCVVFPGHTTLQWTFAVNAWFVGGMAGSMLSGGIADRFGRKRVMQFNCAFIIIGAVVMTSSTGIWMFIVGRLLAGIASGCTTTVVNGFINEVSPPHLRSKLGANFQIAITVGILMVGITYFFANTSSGWRYAAAFPIILAGLFLGLAPFVVVESPSWLLLRGKQSEAQRELARLYGEENVHLAMAWLKSTDKVDPEVGTASATSDPVEKMAAEGASAMKMLLSPFLLRQLVAAVGIAITQQLSGINVVFLYSSDMFTSAGISDDRIGSVAVDFVNVIPTLFSGALASRWGNRRMLLGGMVAMFFCAVGMTVALLVDVPVLSIVFTALYVAAFELSLGPLCWVIIGDLFPDAVRAPATSICMGCNWLATLAIGVGYPYVETALGDLGFLPFVCTLFVFTIFVFYLIPETSGKTNEEIQAGFRAIREHKGNV